MLCFVLTLTLDKMNVKLTNIDGSYIRSTNAQLLPVCTVVNLYFTKTVIQYATITYIEHIYCCHHSKDLQHTHGGSGILTLRLVEQLMERKKFQSYGLIDLMCSLN